MRIKLSNHYCISPFRKDDEHLLAQYFSNPKIQAWLLDVPNPYTKINARNWIEQNIEFYSQNFHHLNLVIRSENGDLIGGIGKKIMPGANYAHSCEIGYWLAEPFWGQGITTLAVKAYTAHLHDNEHFVRVAAIPFSTNLASARILDKCGYKLEGILNKFVAKNKAYLDCKMYACIK
ncbi:MAG: GNAT family N-acetyltransferase [Bacteroidia bacterium]